MEHKTALAEKGFSRKTGTENLPRNYGSTDTQAWRRHYDFENIKEH